MCYVLYIWCVYMCYVSCVFCVPVVYISVLSVLCISVVLCVVFCISRVCMCCISVVCVCFVYLYVYICSVLYVCVPVMLSVVSVLCYISGMCLCVCVCAYLHVVYICWCVTVCVVRVAADGCGFPHCVWLSVVGPLYTLQVFTLRCVSAGWWGVCGELRACLVGEAVPRLPLLRRAHHPRQGWTWGAPHHPDRSRGSLLPEASAGPAQSRALSWPLEQWQLIVPPARSWSQEEVSEFLWCPGQVQRTFWKDHR